MNSTPLGSFDVRDPAPSEIMIVPATLHYDGFEEERTYQLVVEDNRWKIAGTALAQAPLPAVPADPIDAVALFLRTAQSDRSLRQNRAAYYLGGSLRDQVAGGQIAGVSQILKEQKPFFSFRIERVVASDQDNSYVQATLFYQDSTEVKRLFSVSNREEGIWRIFKVSIDDGVGDPADDFPGSNWQVFNQGDFNGDGLVETLFYKEASVTPVDMFVDPDLNQRSFVVGAIMVAQAGAEGPWTMLTVDDDSIRADKVLGRFRSDAAQEGPAAFLFALDPNTDSVFKLLPLKADGTAYTQMVGINWSANASAYRIVGPHGAE